MDRVQPTGRRESTSRAAATRPQLDARLFFSEDPRCRRRGWNIMRMMMLPPSFSPAAKAGEKRKRRGRSFSEQFFAACRGLPLRRSTEARAQNREMPASSAARPDEGGVRFEQFYGTTLDGPSIPSLIADGLPEGFPSGYALDLAERAKACDLTAQNRGTGLAHRNGQPTKPAASLTYLQRTYQGRETQGSHEPAVQTSAVDCEQRWFKAPDRNGEKLPTEKALSNKKADSHRRNFRNARHPAEPVSVPGDRNSSQQQ
ncbi:hypothetical protein HPB51_001018 [Rhipicephalus microplus]|uniref:Uncharacterized protein n=1 Tax=Rhipicephalus microplus TaxID=6941 RepID=A0A9J6DEK5_RHIMP|nr:hypothetical protein HPB51_001018 [Rhipicephalus microplus]